MFDDAHHLLVRLGGDEAGALWQSLGGGQSAGGDYENLGVREQLGHGDVSRRCRAAGPAAGRPGRPRTHRDELLDGAVRMGPRHTTGCLSSTNMPMEMTFHPYTGRHDHAVELRALVHPSMRGRRR